jgi:hypothetical protein
VQKQQAHDAQAIHLAQRLQHGHALYARRAPETTLDGTHPARGVASSAALAAQILTAQTLEAPVMSRPFRANTMFAPPDRVSKRISRAGPAIRLSP